MSIEKVEKVDLWHQLLQEFTDGLKKGLELIKQQNVDNIPGAKDQLIDRFEYLIRYLPKDDGKILVKSIDTSISNSFFPRTDNVPDAFSKILKARTHEQDFIINELINGFIASESKSFGLYKEGPVVDRIIEAFKTSKKLRISDFKLYAMFGVKVNKDPSKVLVERIKKITQFLGLVEEKVTIERDIHRSEKKIITFFTFAPEIIDILLKEKIIINPHEQKELLDGNDGAVSSRGDLIITEEFDKNLFISLFLARFAVDRFKVDDFKINGISTIFGLILILSFMPKVKVAENNPIMRDSHFDSSSMSVIPKGWMAKNVIMSIIPGAIKIVAYRLGLTQWLEKIYTSDTLKKLHLQSRFLLKDVNKWVLGNMCRVEVPIFVEISNIFQEITISGEEAEK